ncbi:HET domain containing protein [Hyaloscypha variabilis]
MFLLGLGNTWGKKRGTRARQSQIQDYVWSEWDWNESKGKYYRFRFNSKGKKVWENYNPINTSNSAAQNGEDVAPGLEALNSSMRSMFVQNRALCDHYDLPTEHEDDDRKACYDDFVPSAKDENQPLSYEAGLGPGGSSFLLSQSLEFCQLAEVNTPAHRRRKISSSKHPRRLEAAVNVSIIPFVPYLDKMDDRLRYLEYIYQKLDEKWIDLGILKTWIKTCDTHHFEHCESSSRSSIFHSPNMPVWLIDVQNSCLVVAQRGNRYVCLSYVWGQDQSEATSMTIDNLAILQQVHSLTSGRVLLPLTISHAISLTRILGIGYLWVDRLCIPQKGDDKTKSDQLNAMAEIYGNSYFTIVAAQGDAQAGLRGISGVTPPRRLVEPLKYQDHYKAFTVQATNLMRSEWYARGWTFQEHISSRRKIIFHNDTVNWECHCDAWYENQGTFMHDAKFACEKMVPNKQTGFQTSSWPDFYRYARLVALYNERSLTYPQDILDAFAGLTTVLRPAFDGGFICGLPQMFFDSALLWQPYRPLQRRRVRKSPGTVLTWPWIPSWSWIGWKGNLHSESWRSGYDYMKRNPDEVLEIDQEGRRLWEPTTWRTKHTVDWCYSEDVDVEQHPINTSSQRYRADALNEKTRLPAGWSRIRPEAEKEYYRHDWISDQEFWYPIPLLDSSTAAYHHDDIQLRPLFLHARTRHCNLILGATYTNVEASQCLCCDLLDTDGKWAGTLRLNISFLSNFEGEGSKCSLVELSSGSVYDQKTEAVSFDEWYRPECPRYDGVYEFYNVLWVEDGGRVVYRKALGRVMKSIWDRLSVQADVILG